MNDRRPPGTIRAEYDVGDPWFRHFAARNHNQLVQLAKLARMLELNYAVVIY
jgi:hypothetical protein